MSPARDGEARSIAAMCCQSPGLRETQRLPHPVTNRSFLRVCARVGDVVVGGIASTGPLRGLDGSPRGHGKSVSQLTASLHAHKNGSDLSVIRSFPEISAGPMWLSRVPQAPCRVLRSERSLPDYFPGPHRVPWGFREVPKGPGRAYIEDPWPLDREGTQGDLKCQDGLDLVTDIAGKFWGTALVRPYAQRDPH
jgi:hypothetical protein